MGRIFNYGDESYDLGNIKNIDTTPFSGGYGGCYVNIHLLKGHEYVFNPDKEITELIEPKIVKGFGEDRHAMSFINAISKEWENYLESKEIQEDDY